MIKPLALLLMISSLCLPISALAGGGHPHGSGHDDAGHSDEPALVYTHYNDVTELFVEFPPLVVERPSTFVAHFTRMDNFKPLTSGVLDVHLKKGNKTVARFRVKRPARTGIFLPKVTAKTAGKYQLVLEVRDQTLHSIHHLGEVTVFPTTEAAQVNQAEPEGEIGYLKEQQWQNPFAIENAQQRPLRKSVPGFGTVTAPPDGFAVVHAAADGYFAAEALLTAGQLVTRNQTLGTLIPRLGNDTDVASLLVALETSRAKLTLARDEVNRLSSLFSEGAIAKKRLLEAQQALEVAQVEHQANQSRLAQQSGQGANAGIKLLAPLAGELVETRVRPGSYVRSGDVLFTVTDTSTRWLEVQIPEKFGRDISELSGAWLQQDGYIQVLDANAGAKAFWYSKTIDPASRSFKAAITYPTEAGPRLLGSRVSLNVYTSKPRHTLAIPASAVVDDGGVAVVYVQTSGETFARRPVTLGIQDGDWVEVIGGVNANEWVVSQGAYYVKLASAGGDAIGHGHAH